MTSGKSDLTDVDDLVLLHETEKAWLFKKPNGDKTWVPKSWGEWYEDEKILTIPQFRAEEKELV